MQNHYIVEITDTFGGEANYCWAKRFAVKAKTMRGAITALAKHQGDKGWRIAYGDNMSARYNLLGACVCAFIDWVELEEITQEYQKINF